ncbi:hypothetical protein AB0N65_06830 [Paenarthrobacter sp. NPDC089322]|uniref:hypothetical protein n=1 Tax=Paenarthrobacter sp. NPDC089322 TaxID=3155065 RepID=UPI003422EAE1
MTTSDYRVGETHAGSVHLTSIWVSHILRNFDLMVIIQVSGCEHIAARVLRGERISPSKRAPLNIANHVAKQKGYLPLFVFSGKDVRVSDGGESVLKDFFESADWKAREGSLL